MARTNLQSYLTRSTWSRKNIFSRWFRHRSNLSWISSIFCTMGELIQLLKTEEFTRKSQIQLRRLRASDLVIIDDLMYMALDQREATLFFQLIHQLYEQRSIILTSNRSSEEWTELVDHQGMMTAILDRLLHRVEIILWITKVIV